MTCCIIMSALVFLGVGIFVFVSVERMKEERAILAKAEEDRLNREKQEQIFRAAEERKRKEKAKQDYIARLENDLKSNEFEIGGVIYRFFGTRYTSSMESKRKLEAILSEMRNQNQELGRVAVSQDISGYVTQVNQFAKLAEKIAEQKRFQLTRMMDQQKYGFIDREYFDSVSEMSGEEARNIIDTWIKYYSMEWYHKLLPFDTGILLNCVWYFAKEKPFSAEYFNNACVAFNSVAECRNMDIDIAEMYAKKQLADEEVLRENIRTKLEENNYTSFELSLLASACMWLKAYQTEKMVLQYMLSNGITMSPKMQERLHSISLGVTDAFNNLEVSTNQDGMLYFDVSPITWNDKEYNALYEGLAFNEKPLDYSLAVRDEDKELFITQGIKMPELTAVHEKMDAVFSEEYEGDVTVTVREGNALSGGGEEKLQGILIEAKECKQLGIFVHIARVGKKVNIKFYTLFLPYEIDRAEQKQQTLSLVKKLSPKVTVWETSMKETALMAIQQLLNTLAQNPVADENETTEDTPIF